MLAPAKEDAVVESDLSRTMISCGSIPTGGSPPQLVGAAVCVAPRSFCPNATAGNPVAHADSPQDTIAASTSAVSTMDPWASVRQQRIQQIPPDAATPMHWTVNLQTGTVATPQDSRRAPFRRGYPVSYGERINPGAIAGRKSWLRGLRRRGPV